MRALSRELAGVDYSHALFELSHANAKDEGPGPRLKAEAGSPKPVVQCPSAIMICNVGWVRASISLPEEGSASLLLHA